VFEPRGDKAEWRVVYDELLVDADYGQIITYAQIAEVLGRDVQQRERLRAPIARARREVGRLRSMWLVAVPNVGYRVIHANEHVSVADDHKHRGQRQFSRMMDVSHATNLSRLTADELTLWDNQTRVNGFLMTLAFSHEKRIRRMEEVLRADGKL
jgi:alkylated DNA nucleotide flippase Atl1